MSDIKKGFMVSMVVVNHEGRVATCTQKFCESEIDARNILRDFQSIQNPDQSPMNVYQQVISGSIVNSNTPDGWRFYGQFSEVQVKPDNLDDAFAPYTVEIEIKRTYTLTIEIDEAASEEDAEDQARHRIENGDEDWRLDCPDDEEIDIENCYKT